MSFVIIGLLLAVIGVGAALTIRAMARAPMGYQDGDGFHFEKVASDDDGTRMARRPEIRSRRPLRPHAGNRHHAA